MLRSTSRLARAFSGLKQNPTFRSSALNRLRLEVLEERRLLSVTEYFVAEVGLNADANPTNLVEMDGFVYFRANDGVSGPELWKTNGTSQGTTLVKDIRPGAAGGMGVTTNITRVGSTLYFVASDGIHGGELWKSNGTAAGTVLVADIRPGADSSYPTQLVNVNGTLFFQANDGTSGIELWKSDGTAAGTVLVKDIRPGGATSSSNPQQMTNLGGALIFAANDGANGVELWKSDGTTEGTFLLKNIQPGNIVSGSYPQWLTEFNGELYFQANDGTNGAELWKTNGTPEGTMLFKNIRPGTSSSGSSPSDLFNLNGTLYFLANDGTNGFELWKSDGTSAGTVLLKSIRSGSLGGMPRRFADLNGALMFVANNGTNGDELWKSDGTSAGTVLVKDIFQGISSSNPTELVNVNGTLYFAATDSASGTELWKSDGTAAGTVLAQDINLSRPGLIRDSSPKWLTNLNGTLLFSADDGEHGVELWRSIPGQPSAYLVKDLRPQSSNSGAVESFTEANGLYFFAANDGKHGNELWKSDGTASGTVMVKDILVGSEAGYVSSNPDELVNVNGIVYFRAFAGPTLGSEVWRSDGTAAGTYMLRNINPEGSSFPIGLRNVNGTLYFNAWDGNTTQWWKSDGTTEGTVPVGNGAIPPATPSPEPNWILFAESEGLYARRDATDAKVIGRHLFYNHSKFDGQTAGVSASDDLAIAPDKLAYLAGNGPASFNNISSYSRGLNGIMVDLHNLAGPVSASDFTFKVGGNNSPATWALAPAPVSISVRPGAGLGETDRIEIIWANGAIKNTWLQVTVKANANTGLSQPDVFYFGNQIGNSGYGDSAVLGATNATDEIAARGNGSFPASLSNPYDYNRDGVVSATDQLVARNSPSTLIKINLSISPPSPLAIEEDDSLSAVASALAFAAADQFRPEEPAPRIEELAVASAPTCSHARYFEQFGEFKSNGPGDSISEVESEVTSDARWSSLLDSVLADFDTVPL